MSKDSSKSFKSILKAPATGHLLFGGIARVLASTVGTFIVVSFGVAIFGVMLATLIGVDNPEWLLFTSTAGQFCIALISEALLIFTVIRITKHRGHKLSDIGLPRKLKWPDLGIGLLGSVAYYALAFAIMGLVFVIWPDLNKNDVQDVGFSVTNSGLDKVLAFIALVIFAPIGEEVLIRGYLFSGLRAVLSFIPTLIITSLLFGLAHLSTGADGAVLWVAGIATLTMSLVVGFLREYTGAIYAGIIVHAINNLVAFMILY
jgi:membrane protease YdiL (CAAX protease family)